MAKQIERVYMEPETVPVGWAFPPLFVLLRTLSKLGIGVVQPIDAKGKPIGKAIQLDLTTIAKYRLMPKRATSEILSKKDLETMAELHRVGR